MLDPKIQEALNDQLNAELYSAYLYLSMAAYFESQNLKGFAHWMRIQAKEEVGHAMKFFDFIHERLGRVTLKEIAAPKTEWKSPLEAFEDAFKHEQHVTERIHKIFDLAKEKNDYPTQVFLHWFIEEQVEEEASADEIVQKLRMIGEDKGALLALDSQLAAREPEEE